MKFVELAGEILELPDGQNIISTDQIKYATTKRPYMLESGVKVIAKLKKPIKGELRVSTGLVMGGLTVTPIASDAVRLSTCGASYSIHEGKVIGIDRKVK